MLPKAPADRGVRSGVRPAGITPASVPTVVLKVVLAVALLFPGGCAHRSANLIEDVYGTLLDDLALIAEPDEMKPIRQAARSSDAEFDDVLEAFWAGRDPTPDTPRNEFRELFEGRREVAAFQLVFPGCYLPDDRRRCFILHGPPARIEESSFIDAPYLTWFYELEERLRPAVSTHPLLAGGPWYASFHLRGTYGYALESYFERTRLPERLEDHDRQVLIDLAKDTTRSDPLRTAAAWRLSLDLHPVTLAALLELADNAAGPLFESVSAGLAPLPESGPASGGTRPLVLDTPTTAVPMTGPPAEAALRPATVTDELLVEREAAVYDPGQLLTATESTELETAGREAGLEGINRSWLTPEDAALLFTGTIGEVRDLLADGRLRKAHALIDQQLRRELLREPEAWHLDAIILLALGEPGSRQLAEERVRQAIRLNPGDARYRMTLARILYNRTFGLYSDRTCDQVLEEQPGIADAYALKAQMRLTLLYGLGWHGSTWAQTPHGEGPTTMEAFRTEAHEFLNRALTADPDNLLATWYLGADAILNAWRTEDWSSILPVMNYLIEQGAHAAEAHLGRGLALQSLGRLNEAQESYEAALAVLSDEKAAIANDPRWSLPPGEGGIVIETAVTGVAAAADTAATARYWRSEDPLFTTAVNERQLEQYRRLGWVTWHYAIPELGLRGWDTVRGRVYLRYGEPDRTNSNLSRLQQRMGGAYRNMPDPQAAALDYFDWPQESWEYGEKIFTFGGSFASGNLTFWPIWAEIDDPAFQEFLARCVMSASDYAEYAGEVPDRDRVIGAPTIYPLATTWYRFEDPAAREEFVGVVNLPLFVEAPGQEPRAPTDRAQIVMLSDEWYRVRQDTLALPPGSFVSPARQMWVTPPLTTPSGAERVRYIAVELLPNFAGDPVYAGRDTLARAMTAGPRLSSLVLAREVQDRSDAGSWQDGTWFARGEWAVAPWPGQHIRRKLPIYLYFETYGLNRDEYGTVSYELAYSITAVDREQSVLADFVDALGRLIGRRTDEGTVTLRFDREGIATRASEWQRVVFPDEASEGTYLVTLAVTDKTTGERTERSALLHITR